MGELVALTRAGRNMKARCPFHQERSPSFIVSPERQTFHCFGCGEGGDAFSFIMKSENLTFMEAAEKLALRAGVKIEAEHELGPQEKERLRMREANEFAAEYYREVLKEDPGAQAARAYVCSRRLSAAAVEHFKVGYAPRNGRLVFNALKKGFSEGILLKAGLAARRPDGTVRDYFFDRLMFPIRDAKGAFVGFGGRTLGEGEPKYLNTAESPVFSKGRVLYGLYEGLAETRKARTSHLMEGYMDVIASHQHGLKTSCAPLGTALTPEHATLIKRYADAVVIVFDADTAGQSAAVRGAEVALESGLSTRVASVPEGKDPDEFLHAKGLAAFEAVLEAAQDLVAFKTELLIKRAGPLTPEAKSAIAKDVLATILRCPDEVLKDEWVRRLSARLGVNEDSLRRSGGKAVAQNRHSAAPAAAGDGALAAAAKPGELTRSDAQLLGLLFKTPASAREILDTDLDSPSARVIVSALRELASCQGRWGPRLLDALPEAERGVASRLFNDDLGYEDAAATLRALTAKRRAQRRLKEIEPLVLSGSDAPVDQGLRDEFQRLVAELKGTKR